MFTVKFILILRRLTALLLAGLLSACANLDYYSQAVVGQLQLWRQQRPVDAILADPATPPPLRRRLETARRMRAFASAELGLPDNNSYRGYVDLHRPYVVLNVFAAPELSLQLREWCFPVVGCVGYRGYFDGAAARRFGADLRARGDDVYLGVVPAYSTLGWFNDPLLNTFIGWSDGRLAELVFHELAHQRLFIAGDTDFNESFATAVGQAGARRWLERHGDASDRQAYEVYTRQRDEFLTLALATRDELERLYASDRAVDEKRREKQRALVDLQTRYRALKQRWGGYSGYDGWFTSDLNNAKLGSLHAYTRFAPAFQTLLAEAGQDFSAFYRASEAVARLPPEQREACLETLLGGGACAPGRGTRLAGLP